MRSVTAAEMTEIDRRTIEEFGVPAHQLMENAGKAVARQAAQMAGPAKPVPFPQVALPECCFAAKVPGFMGPKGKPGTFGNGTQILILAGKGNNGGDGLVAARYLHLKNYSVQVLLFVEGDKLKQDPARNFVQNAKLGIHTQVVGEHFKWESLPDILKKSDLVIDALFGVGLARPLEEPYLKLIKAVNRFGKKILSVDIPSGLHADSGEILGACIKADVTVTLGLAKKGFYEGGGPKVVGEIVVADIGFPKELIEK